MHGWPFSSWATTYRVQHSSKDIIIVIRIPPTPMRLFMAHAERHVMWNFHRQHHGVSASPVVGRRAVMTRPTQRHWFRSLTLSQTDSVRKVDAATTTTTAVGIFIDLDNMSDGTFPIDRLHVAQRIRPLRRFAGRCFGDGATTVQIKAYANRPTQTYKNRRGVVDDLDDDDDDPRLEQEYWEPMFGDADSDLFPGAMVQTGYDEEGILRCGVCGAKMKLTKKDRARGWSEHDKLNKHMKMLHDREQKKRQNRLTQLKGGKKGKVTQKAQRFLQGKEGQRMQKYKAAQVGLNRGHKNDWFPILKEESVQTFSCDDVDATLIKAARKWVQKQLQRHNESAKCEDEKMRQQPQNLLNIVLMVVSEDSDFVRLLETVSRRRKDGVNFYSACATWNSAEQTQALVSVTDFVLTVGTTDGKDMDVFALNVVAATARGNKLLQAAIRNDTNAITNTDGNNCPKILIKGDLA
jgi:hypothetical protein